jgi:large subunit ribosomal protein L29
MTSSSANDFRQMSEAEIQNKLNEAKAELFNLRIQHSISQLTNPSRISVVKRDIARMKTVLRERQIALEVARSEEKK